MRALNQCVHNPWKTSFVGFGLALALVSAPVRPLFAAGPELVVDRGLPQANLNNSAGDYRSNIRWSLYDSGFLGDDFALGGAGESWVIDTIRVWTIPGVNGRDPGQLGDYYQDVRLYFGGAEGDLTPLVTGQLTAGASRSSNPHILISDATAARGALYDDFGSNMRVWQIDFTGLNLKVEGGAKYRFGAFGLGRDVPNKSGKTYAWFNAGANAELAATRQDGADGKMLLFSSGGKFQSVFDGKGAGWDKSSDISVQVFAHRAE